MPASGTYNRFNNQLSYSLSVTVTDRQLGMPDWWLPIEIWVAMPLTRQIVPLVEKYFMSTIFYSIDHNMRIHAPAVMDLWKAPIIRKSQK